MPITDGGQPARAGREQVDEDDADPDIGQRDEQGGEVKGDLLRPAVVSHPRHYTERYRDEAGKQEAAGREQQCIGQGLRDQLDDRGPLDGWGAGGILGATCGAALLAADEGIAEVTLGDIAEIAQELHRDGITQPEAFGCLLHGARRCHRAEDDTDRIARGDAQQRENDEGDGQDDENALTDTPQEEFQCKSHRWVSGDTGARAGDAMPAHRPQTV